MPLQPKLLLIAISCFFFHISEAQQFAGLKSVGAVADTVSHKIDYLSPNSASITDSVVNYGKLFLNTPYHYGATGTSAFDCSGFTSFVYRNFGYNLERSSFDQARQFDTVQRSELKVGDLVFFSGRRKSKSVGHVGIVTSASNGNFSFIHASVHDGVIISNSEEEYYSKRFIKANRVINGTRFLAVASTPKAEIKLDNKPDNRLPSPVNSPARQSKKIIPAEYHRVKRGETLSSIALKYGLTIAELKQKNNIKGNKINLKQQLKVKDEEVLLIVEPMMAAASKAIDSSSTAITSKHETTAQPVQVASTHEVKKGETFFSIASLHHISVDELRKLNNIKGGSLKAGQKLKLSVPVEVAAPIAANTMKSEPKTSHKVLRGETLTSIAKLYNVSVAELKKLNNLDNTGIRSGQELKVNPTSEALAENETVLPSRKETAVKTETHEVKRGESLYSISKEKNISVEEIKKLNNITENKLRAGQKLDLPSGAQGVVANARPNTITHKVTVGESFYSIAKLYGCTIDNLKEWNNRKDNNINTGETLVIHPKSI